MQGRNVSWQRRDANEVLALSLVTFLIDGFMQCHLNQFFHFSSSCFGKVTISKESIVVPAFSFSITRRTKTVVLPEPAEAETRILSPLSKMACHWVSVKVSFAVLKGSYSSSSSLKRWIISSLDKFLNGGTHFLSTIHQSHRCCETDKIHTPVFCLLFYKTGLRRFHSTASHRFAACFTIVFS